MKKIIAIVISILVILLGSLGVYTVFFKQDKDTTLTLVEKQWIENNKNHLIDLNIVNNIPVFNYNGNGLLFDFTKELEDKTGLEFNKIPYSLNGEVTSEYAFKITDEVKDNELLIYEDEYVITSKEQMKYDNLSTIGDITLGILESDLQRVNYYLQINKNIKIISYKNISELVKAYNDKKIDALAIPKTFYLDQILENELNINYNISEVKSYLVLQLGSNDKLNTIIKKYYNKWYNESYENSYGDNLTDYYFYKNDVDDDSKVAFRSKQYKYGFVDYAPYDKVVKGTLSGINNTIITEFTKLTNVEVKFYEYSTIEDLIANFNSNKIDMYFDMSSIDNFDMDVYDTISPFDEEIVVLSHISNKQTINSVYSLKNKNVMTIKDTDISNLMHVNDIEIKEYKTLKSMLNNLDKNYLIVLDKEVYNAYKSTLLKEYVEVYSFDIEANYNYKIRNISDNKVFAEYFDFYLSFIDVKNCTNKINYKIFNTDSKSRLGFNIIIISSLILIIICALLFSKKKKKNMKKAASGVSKENRIKYIDMLTSLKNRNYLNDSIEKWDECDIYPQAIIIIDLNNITYINDNYGHAEGDNVIKEAASILFNNQIENSEIMRTNGNEFLIYLVNYDEKQVLSYIKKLTKELKELSHGFGAASGYSMINDGLKSIDDAINEATLDMKTNKEEAR